MRTLIRIPICILTHSRIHILFLCHHLYLNPHPNPYSTPYPNSYLNPTNANPESVSSALTMTLTLIGIDYMHHLACVSESVHSSSYHRISHRSHPTFPHQRPCLILPTATPNPGLIDLQTCSPHLNLIYCLNRSRYCP